MAEEAQREGAPGQEVEVVGDRDPDKLLAVQQEILAATRTAAASTDADDSVAPVQSVQPAIRRFTGDKRTERVGPLRFTPEERIRLQVATAANDYWGESGFAADVVLAFIDGQFFIDLPLAEERRHTHVFRVQVLRALNGIGHNINQIARALNGGYQPPADSRQKIDELHTLLTQIAEALRPPANVEEA
ncbi:MobC family plasmid mobilization relaxosome protein [Kitasatospora sp. NPDC050463]|uniref:MobC family plasmid mobilization relaxosome protein n=1 Tax=Kitasatospora sp. NPDC050463 TaxID=3155786 RepID=UPI0033F6BDD4